MVSDEYVKYIAEEVAPIISKVSLTLATLVVLTMIVLTIYDYKLVNRVTLRLQTVISCFDIWLHSFPLWSHQYSYDGSPLCTFIGYQLLAFPLFYAFLNVAIGVNLQLVFVHGIAITKRIEAGYWIGSILLTLIISIPPLAMGMFGYTEFNGCYLSVEDQNIAKTFDFYASILITMICMLYLLVIVILVIVILSKQTKKIQNFRLFRGAKASVEAAKSVKIMGFRILLYPIIMIVSQSGLVINQTAYDLFDFTAPELFIFTMITSGILGTLNFTAFCCDPTIHSAFRKIYLRITTKSRLQDVVNDEVGSEVMLSTRDNLDDIDQSNSSFTFSTEKVDGKMLTEIIQNL